MDLANAIKEGSTSDIENIMANPQSDINALDPAFNGGAALHFAVKNSSQFENFADMIQLLLSHPHCNVNVKDYDGRTPLHHAALSQNVVAAKALIEHPACDLNLTDDIGGLTPLHLAAIHYIKPQSPQKDTTSVMDLLLEHSGDRCDVNATTRSWNENCLHMICREPFDQNRLELIGKLLKNTHFLGWNAKDRDNLTVLNRLVHEHGKQQEKLVRLLIQSQKCDLCERFERGDTVLHLAVRRQRCQWVSALLATPQSDCLINAIDNYGDSPLQHVPQSSAAAWEEVAILLISHPLCNVNYRQSKRHPTVLHIAVQLNAVGVLKALIKCGRCNFLCQESSGNTALHLIPSPSKPVANPSHTENSLQLLLDLGIFDLRAVNKKGLTPLSQWFAVASHPYDLCAGWKGSFRSLKMFVDHGADVNAEDLHGDTLLSYFVNRAVSLLNNNACPHREIPNFLTLLLDAGLDTDSNATYLALHKAREHNNKDLHSICGMLAAEGVSTDPVRYEKERVVSPATLTQNAKWKCIIM